MKAERGGHLGRMRHYGRSYRSAPHPRPPDLCKQGRDPPAARPVGEGGGPRL